MNNSNQYIKTIKANVLDYNIPVFKIDKEHPNQTQIRIKTIEYDTNYYNIGFCDNYLAFLRKVEKIENYKEEPYIINKCDKEEYHLCILRIKPGYYNTIQDIIAQINITYHEAMVNFLENNNVVLNDDKTQIIENNTILGNDLLFQPYNKSSKNPINVLSDFITLDGNNYVFNQNIYPVQLNKEMYTSYDHYYKLKHIIPINDTVLLQKILECNNEKFDITNNLVYKSIYFNEIANINKYYNYYTFDKSNLFEKLGIIYESIKLENLLYIENLNEYAEIITGSYYKELLYDGILINPFSNEETIIHPNIFNRSFMKTTNLNIHIPFNIFIKICYNKDIEYLINNFSENSLTETSSLYVIKNDNTLIFDFENQYEYNIYHKSINIEKLVSFFSDSSIYVYITSSDSKYPIIQGAYNITVEYI